MWFPILLSALSLAACAVGVQGADATAPDIKSIALRTHTLAQPYLESDMQSRWWEFGGDTIIRSDKYVRLTPDKPSRGGWIFSRVPLTATNWEIEVEFELHGSGTLHGDGFAMWLTRQRATPGPVFGSVDKFEGLGIFFDTYKNNRPGTVFPYVMAMIGDGETVYDKNNDGKANEFAGCSARGLRTATVPTKARLTYFQEKSLKLELQYKTEDDWVLCFEKENPPAVPSVAYLGFSAQTGELSDNHDIISVQTKNLYTANTGGSAGRPSSPAGQRQGGKGKKYEPKKSSTSGSWTWFFLRIILFFLVAAGAYVGYTIWRTSKRSHRF